MTRTFDERLDNYGVTADGCLAIRRPGKWIGYAAAGATVGLAGGTDADVIYSGTVNAPIIGSVGLDVNSDLTNDFILRFYGSFISASSQSFFADILATNGNIMITGSNTVRNVPSGSPIMTGPRSSFPTFLSTYDGFTNYGPGDGTIVAGGSFTILGATHNAWLRVNLDNSPGFAGSMTLIDFAYENTPGVQIDSLEIPEPSALATSSLALLALGAAGVSHYRKTKAKVATA